MSSIARTIVLSLFASWHLSNHYLVVSFTPLTPPYSTRPLHHQSTLRHNPLSTLHRRDVRTLASPCRRINRQSSLTKQKPLTALASAATTTSAVTLGSKIAVLGGALSGGVFAGGLHAIAGPDHLASLLPQCVGQRWYHAGKIGALWGMGHGVSATIIGIVAFFCKTRVNNAVGNGGAAATAAANFWSSSQFSSLTEIAVGLSLIVIGLMGIREAREWEDELLMEQEAAAVGAGASAGASVVAAQSQAQQQQQQKSLSAAANLDLTADGVRTADTNNRKRAIIFNGLLHGFSWDGAPSLAPALAVATWGGNLTFLLAYATGTVAVMSIVTTLIGEGTRRAGRWFHRPDIPQKLSFGSSIFAITIGVVWCAMAFLS